VSEVETSGPGYTSDRTKQIADGPDTQRRSVDDRSSDGQTTISGSSLPTDSFQFVAFFSFYMPLKMFHHTPSRVETSVWSMKEAL
jgi:hypothetical protein